VTGTSITFQVQIIDGREGTIRSTPPPISASRDAPHLGVEELRERVTAALATQLDGRLSEWIGGASKPPTLEAYQDLASALDEWHTTADMAFVEEHLRLASRADSSFTLPLLWLLWLVEEAEFDQLVARLEARRSTLPPLEQSLLDYHTARSAAGAYRATLRIVEVAPHSYFLYKAGKAALRGMNRPLEAIDLLQQANLSGLLADYPNYWSLVAEAYHVAGNHEAELRTARASQGRFPNSRQVLWDEVTALAAMGRTGELEQLLESHIAFKEVSAQTRGQLMLQASDELRAHGHLRAADEYMQRAFRWFDETGGPALNDIYMTISSLIYAGRLEEASTLLIETARTVEERGLAPHILIIGLQGTLAAARGDRATALERSETLRRLYTKSHLDRQVTSGYAAVLRARIAVLMGERDRAVRLFGNALTLGFRRASWLHSDPLLASLRGYEAFEELIRPKG
jgi:hypothetical protein